MKKSKILGFFIIYVSLSIFKISSTSETWSPESIRSDMEHTIYIYLAHVIIRWKNSKNVIIMLMIKTLRNMLKFYKNIINKLLRMFKVLIKMCAGTFYQIILK